jgi:hypothetical protein
VRGEEGREGRKQRLLFLIMEKTCEELAELSQHVNMTLLALK